MQKAPNFPYTRYGGNKTRQLRPCYFSILAETIVVYSLFHSSTRYTRCPAVPCPASCVLCPVPCREFGRADGPPLSMDEQLCGLPQLPVLRALSPVHVRRLRLRRPRLRTPLSCHGQQHRCKD